MEGNEEQLNQKLTQVSIDQELNRKERWQLEELERDYQRLSMQHEEFLTDIIQSTQDKKTSHYFSSMEEEIEYLHKHNLSDLEDKKEYLQRKAKEFIHSEQTLIEERKKKFQE
ncbi:DUF3958 family protein [Enterococcus sp. BWR-S5]|uniref:DUF3958 family protein n=1 Tax=Enterococcus sp. BWR-S5 TaxID=2787714 RepID=UPI001923725D|nr:DUF3958 family protein [Enterococcus sp. BWR-S5]MBL1224598.1 DUF3958 family protein [Enterococcus sp. BWR-S5]